VAAVWILQLKLGVSCSIAAAGQIMGTWSRVTPTKRAERHLSNSRVTNARPSRQPPAASARIKYLPPCEVSPLLNQ